MFSIEKSIHYYNYAQQYLMMPKAVEEYLTVHDVSLGACKLYMHLRDRYRLSLESVSEGNNKYEDELGVFCIFTIEDLVEIMNKNEKTIRRWYNELKKCDIIHYRQVKKESGQANRFYIKEEQLVDSELIALYTSKEYKPVVHYAQIGADKNVQSMSGQKCPPINNSSLTNNIKKDYVLSYIENHNVDVYDDLKERIAEDYIGSILPIDEVNERLENMISTYKKNDDEETDDPYGHWKSHNEKKQSSGQTKQEAAVEEGVTSKVEKVHVQGSGYVDSEVMPEGTHNPFKEDLNEDVDKTTNEEIEATTEQTELSYDVEPLVIEFTEWKTLDNLCNNANRGFEKYIEKCKSEKAQRYIILDESGRFKVRDNVGIVGM